MHLPAAKSVSLLAAAMLIVLLLAVDSRPAPAALVAQDQFIIGVGNYTAGTSIVGQNSASAIGFTGNWTGDTGVMLPNTENLTYGAGGRVIDELATGGGSVQIDLTPYNDTLRNVYHSLSGLPASGTYYVSGLISMPADPNGNAVIRLETGTSGPGFGFLGNGAVFQPYGSTVPIPGARLVPNQPALFVMRVDVNANGANDRVSVWFNPAQYSGEAAAGPAKLVNDSFDVWAPLNPPSTLRLFTQNLGGAGIAKFDEVRLGTSWEDVVVRVNPDWTHLGFQEGVLPTAAFQHLGTEAREGSPGGFQGTDVNIRVGNLDNNPGVQNMRTLLAFDLGALPAAARIEEITLRMTVDSVQDVGNVGAIELHRVLPGPGGQVMVESQANWNQRMAGVPWSTPGGDFDPAVLAVVPGSVTATLAGGMEMVFSSSDALVAAAQDAFVSGVPLELILIAPGANNGFIRFRSDDWGSSQADYLTRPLLSIAYSVPEPSSLLLAAVGLAPVVLLCRRRR